MPSNFNPNIPIGNVKINATYQAIQLNFSQLDTSFGVNHFAFSNQTTANGKHKFVEMPLLNPSGTTTPPATLSGEGSLYTSIPTASTSTELFYTNGNSGNAFQLTDTYVANIIGNFNKFATNPGWTFLPGGLILQWGSVSSVKSSYTTITFTVQGGINFPGGIYNVWTQLFDDGSHKPTSNNTISISSLEQTTFQYIAQNTNNYTGFYYFALGF